MPGPGLVLASDLVFVALEEELEYVGRNNGAYNQSVFWLEPGRHRHGCPGLVQVLVHEESESSGQDPAALSLGPHIPRARLLEPLAGNLR